MVVVLQSREKDLGEGKATKEAIDWRMPEDEGSEAGGLFRA